MNKIDIKKCSLKDLSFDTNIVKDFFKEQKEKYIDFTKAYGLFYKNDLIHIILLGKPRFDKNFSWELLKNLIKNNCYIDNGFKTLWKFANKNCKINTCVYYSNKEESYNDLIDCGFYNLDNSMLEDEINNKISKYFIGDVETYSYVNYSVVYKITDIDTGKFYIGETTNGTNFLRESYDGSGRKWREYYEEFKDKHNFKREVLKDDFKSPKELYDYELKEIIKYCDILPNGNYKVNEATGCMNMRTNLQGTYPICPECGSSLFKHNKYCSYYKEPTPCSECGRIYGHHTKICSKYGDLICKECGGLDNNHKKYCSKYNGCPECGVYPHSKECSKFNANECPECNGRFGHHKKGCSKYKEPNTEYCEFCGTPSGGFHEKWCPNHELRNVCKECGTPYGNHTKACSLYKPKSHECPECHAIGGYHKNYCSKFKFNSKICQYCGNRITMHKIDCPLRDNSKNCPYCNTPPGGKHKKDCPNFRPVVCSECEGRSNNHLKTCSKYKEKKPCPICGSKSRHKEWCSKKKRI